DEDRQNTADDEIDLDVIDGALDVAGVVGGDGDGDAIFEEGGTELLDELAEVLGDLHRVRAGLLHADERERRLAVEERSRARLFHRVDDFGDIAHAHGGATESRDQNVRDALDGV